MIKFKFIGLKWKSMKLKEWILHFGRLFIFIYWYVKSWLLFLKHTSGTRLFFFFFFFIWIVEQTHLFFFFLVMNNGTHLWWTKHSPGIYYQVGSTSKVVNTAHKKWRTTMPFTIFHQLRELSGFCGTCSWASEAKTHATPSPATSTPPSTTMASESSATTTG